MRLVFMYHSEKHAPKSGMPILYHQRATNKFAEGIKEEGYFWILKRLLETKVVDEILLIIESTAGQGCIHYMPNFTGWVFPDIYQFNEYLRHDDIIWCRGGHRSNHDFLVEASKKGHWVMLYAANTGRQKWKLWDVVLTDFGVANHIDIRGRFWFYWKKPINPEIFRFTNQERIYDICIGASNIHDKKGQWRVIDALVKHKKMYHKNLNCILPGGFYHGALSNDIADKIREHGLHVKLTGLVPRPVLAQILNQSKLFINGGSYGENDRGPLEAMRCGCFVMITTPGRHSPVTHSNPDVSYIFKKKADMSDSFCFGEMALEIEQCLKRWNEDVPKKVIDYYESVSGIETVVLPEMAKLIKLMRNNEPGDPNTFHELLK